MLAQLGYAGACDVVGGFEAWREAGLPVVPAPKPRDRLRTVRQSRDS
jgi:hypothetical protein